MKIVVDCFGGDNAPIEAVIGSINALMDSEELSLASEIKDMTLEEFSNKYGVQVNGIIL